MKYAIVFSTENRIDRDQFDDRGSSPFEKMALALVHSIRMHDDCDVYCATFTQNKLSSYARLAFIKAKVKVVDPVLFPDIGRDEHMFLRSFTKQFFGRMLLDQYDYLIYIDPDAVMLAKPKFDFDPTGRIITTSTMPQWVVNYHNQQLDGLRAPLVFSWVDIINKHNVHLHDFDWEDPVVRHNHYTNVEYSNRLLNTELQLIEQRFGGYHNVAPTTADSIFYHYDSLEDFGSLYVLKQHHSKQLAATTKYIEQELRIKIANQEGYWEAIAKAHQ